MKRLRALAVIALVAGVVTAPATAASAATNSGQIVVPVDGTTVSTPFATVSGHTYRLTVTGAYSYNGRQNLADCGWWNPEWAGDAWFPGSAFRVDGSPAPCASQPYTTSHTYTWTQPGTGAPLRFSVADSMPYDNVGALSVTVVEEYTAPRLAASCATPKVLTDSELGLITVHATLRVSSSGGSGTASVDGYCRLVGPTGTAATVYAYGTSPEAVGTDVVLLPMASYQVCVDAYAYWFLDWHSEYVGYCRPL